MLDPIIGNCPAIERFRRQLPSFANASTPLVLIGEPGAGKAFLASHIHARSPLHATSIASLNFSILSERDQRVGLFGGEPPELTTSRRSLLELNTTVVLKHIDCASIFLQDKLASTLTCSNVNRLGSGKPHPVQARVIFTFRDTIPLMKRKQTLTAGLFGFINPLRRIHLPSLRERKDDISLLTRYCALKEYDKFRHLSGFSIRGISPDGAIDSDLLGLVKNQRWKDNVRDLYAFIRILATFPFREELCNSEKFEIVKLAISIEDEREFSLSAELEMIQRRLIGKAVQRFNRQITKVAHHLGLSERAIKRNINLVIIVFIWLWHLTFIASEPC